MTVNWQEPPPDNRKQGRYRVRELDALADEIKSRPGKWALVEANSFPGNGEKYKRRGLEVIYRKTGDGRGQDIYARYNPQPRRQT